MSFQALLALLYRHDLWGSSHRSPKNRDSMWGPYDLGIDTRAAGMPSIPRKTKRSRVKGDR